MVDDESASGVFDPLTFGRSTGKSKTLHPGHVLYRACILVQLQAEMSDFLKKFKSVFVLEDEGTASATPAAATPNPQQTVPETPATPVRPVSESGNVTDKFVQILLGALEKNNQQGFDYFEFRQSLKNLEKMPMDEATRFHSAYAMAQTMNVTPAKLIESAQFYLNVLAGEQSKFNEAHAQQRAKLIGNREDEVRNLEAMILSKTEQIKQLTLQIEEHRKNSEQIRNEIGDSTIKIENTKADFEATFANVAGQIQDDVAKIQQHLK
jgi:hypothetical protein